VGTLIVSAALAAAGPLVVAHAMNNHMWEHPATVANIATLRARGVHVVGPGIGAMAEPESGPGRLAAHRPAVR
jgi:phosphopantothenoylcysteine decarboxylase/phosphopantothenate--cysteine ligase